LARPVAAQTCPNPRFPTCGYDCAKTPAAPVPRSFWGQLQPVDTAPYPDNRDETGFDEFTGYYSANPYYFSIDIQNGWAFTAMDYGVKVWNVSAGGKPVFQSYLTYQSFPYWNPSEQKTPIQDVSLPPGVDTVGALAGIGDTGLTIVDFTNKSMPKLLYQNAYGDGFSVVAETLGGTHYAFFASNGEGLVPAGIQVYNMDQAEHYTGCRDNTPGDSCPGVYVGKIPLATGAAAPVLLAGVDHFIAGSYISNVGVDIWDVTNPTNPVHKLSAINNFGVHGIAMWKDPSSGHYLLAARAYPNFASPPGSKFQLQILDVNCITSTCTSVPQPVSTFPDTTDTSQTANYLLTFSLSGTTPFLYLGSDQSCGNPTAQREWLLDVSNPLSPQDITPPSTEAGGYWGWYYMSNTATGFNYIMPRHGKFSGQYFYRTAESLFDVHQRVGAVAPTAAFTWSPSQIYPGTAVSFSDQSSGVPNSWSWTFSPDGSPSTSSQQNPASVTFASAGTKSVSLQASNSTGSNSTSQNVVVLPAQPQVASISVSPPSPLQCQPVTLTANGASGEPPLSWSWGITTGGNPAPGGTSAAANTFTWDSGANAAVPGAYTATLTINNTSGTSVPSQVNFSLGSLPSLPASSTFAPTNDSFASGTVQFHVNVAGATSWNWNFGDGSGFTGWTNDPVNGPNPLHTYNSVGGYSVQVMVRNCVNLGGATSSNLAVNITQTTPLIASFSPQCFVAPCAFSVNSPIVFSDNSTGAQFWDYDWTYNGSGTPNFTDAGHTSPVTSHTYTAAGTYQPALRVRRGASEQNTDIFSSGLVVSAVTQPARITVTGPTSGNTGTAYTFFATGSNCTPSATWSWTATSGTISGSSTGSSITVTWGTAGGYSVTATNSGCSGAFGSTAITISTSGGGGGGLQAAFVFSPASPAVGQTVSFDGSSSTGSPTGYTWYFGDGTTGSGVTSTHAYSQGGTYTVKLDAQAPGACQLGLCVSELAKTIVVQGQTAPPPLNPAFTSPSCTDQFGIVTCAATTAQTVTLTAADTRATTVTWNFGDGTTGSGGTVTHSWAQPQNYTVTLTVSAAGYTTESMQEVFAVTGPPPPSFQSVVLPWVAETRGALVQSCDLYMHNPGASAVNVTLQFLKRGLPVSSPPTSTATIQPGATLYAPDVLNSLFQVTNTSGFVMMTVKTTDPLPVVTSYNTVTRGDGSQFGQTIPSLALAAAQSTSNSSSPATSTFQDLIGLNDNTSELAYFGVTNPTAAPVTYHVRLFDDAGSLLGESSSDFVVGSFGQRQFQQEDVQTLFGLTSASDYRVEVENKSTGTTLVPYGENVRLVSSDPSFLTVGTTSAPNQYVVGAFSNTGTWQTDVVLANTGTQPVTVTLTFTRTGVLATATPPVGLTLNPGQTQRLTNAIATEWNLTNVVGVITVASTSANGTYATVQAESYNNANPASRFGQSMGAFSDADAAVPGQTHYLVGLRQDANHLATFWLFNSSTTDYGVYDVVYRNLDGTVLGTVSNVSLPPGKVRQFLPSNHPLPAGGVTNGFTVQVVVKSGTAITAAQILTPSTGDPAYIQGTAE
jgi:PKD repeat protein